jgi:hypothetical protein
MGYDVSDELLHPHSVPFSSSVPKVEVVMFFRKIGAHLPVDVAEPG